LKEDYFYVIRKVANCKANEWKICKLSFSLATVIIGEENQEDAALEDPEY